MKWLILKDQSLMTGKYKNSAISVTLIKHIFIFQRKSQLVIFL